MLVTSILIINKWPHFCTPFPPRVVTSQDFSPGAGDGWGIFFLPTGQALVSTSQLQLLDSDEGRMQKRKTWKATSGTSTLYIYIYVYIYIYIHVCDIYIFMYVIYTIYRYIWYDIYIYIWLFFVASPAGHPEPSRGWMMWPTEKRCLARLENWGNTSFYHWL